MTAPGEAARVDVADILVRLAELGPPSQVRSHAPALAAEALGYDRVLLSGIVEGRLVAEALHLAPAGEAGEVLDALRRWPVALEYPLVEGELMRRRRAQVVRAEDDDRVAKRAFADVLGWTVYVTAPIVLDGRTIGFLHADRQPSGRELCDADATHLATFASCFGVIYERAVLRHRLRVQREELLKVSRWLAARTSELDSRPIALGESAGHEEETVTVTARAENPLRDLLTRRELEVLELMVQGETNAGIARDLVLSEGTVKFHVKNILRKLHAANRAEAASRYLRLTMNQGAAR